MYNKRVQDQLCCRYRRYRIQNVNIEIDIDFYKMQDQQQCR